MVKIKVIFGEAACGEYDETQDLKKVRSCIRREDGEIKTITFQTEGEYRAYLKGLNDGNGWEEYWVVEKNGEKI